MLDTIRSIFSLLLSYGLLLLANGLFNTLIGVRTKLEEFPTEIIGVISACHFVGLLFGANQAIKIVWRVGHIRAFAAFASLMSITALAPVLWVNPYAWMLLRIATGFCMAGMIMVTESWLNARSARENRGQVMALYMITNYLAAGSGQLLLNLADPSTFYLFSIASIIFSLAVVPVLLTQSSAPNLAPLTRLPLRQLWLISPLGVAGACCAGLVNATFYGMGPVFAHDIGLSIQQTSLFMASVVLGGLLLQWPIGRLSDRLDRRVVLVVVVFTVAAACLAMAQSASHGMAWLYGIGLIYGGLSFTIYSISNAHANDHADPDKLVQTASGLLIAYGVGAIAGPMIAAFIMGQAGPHAMFYYNGTIAAGLGFFALYRMLRRPSVSSTQRLPIIVLPGGQFTAGQLYAAVRRQLDRQFGRGRQSDKE
ncbi:MAG: MFS transporter [Gammaproteobacteria bacterium]